VSPRRPSFTGKGSEASEYAWFVWDDNPPTVAILDTGQRDNRMPSLFHNITMPAVRE
jgi:hypothetical protein